MASENDAYPAALGSLLELLDGWTESPALPYILLPFRQIRTSERGMHDSARLPACISSVDQVGERAGAQSRGYMAWASCKHEQHRLFIPIATVGRRRSRHPRSSHALLSSPSVHPLHVHQKSQSEKHKTHKSKPPFACSPPPLNRTGSNIQYARSRVG